MKKQKKTILVLVLIAAFIAAGLFLPGLIGAGNLDAPVEKTGQTGCWDASGIPIPCAGTGQDGDLQKGVTWPNPRFTDNGDGTVTDNLTGLIWLKNANCFSFRNLANALSDCNGLADGACGLTDGSVAGDWRLPNVRELHSLVHFSFYNLAVPNTAGTGKWTAGDPFTNVQNSEYLSSTTFASSTNLVWTVAMFDGSVSTDAKTESSWVWPVRDSVSDGGGGGGGSGGCFIATAVR